MMVLRLEGKRDIFMGLGFREKRLRMNFGFLVYRAVSETRVDKARRSIKEFVEF